MIRVNYYKLLVGIALFGALPGCSKHVPFEGVVTLDGEPLAAATLTFIPFDKDASGPDAPKKSNAMTDPEGRFSLHTINDDGIIPAKYRVIINKRYYPPGMKPPDPNNFAELMAAATKMIEYVPELYTNEKTTPLEFEVTPDGHKDVRFDLTSK